MRSVDTHMTFISGKKDHRAIEIRTAYEEVRSVPKPYLIKYMDES